MALPQRYLEKDSYTAEEYLAFEDDAPIRSEYVHGYIRAMSGGTDYHAAVTFNLSVALGVALKGRDFRGLSSDMKVLTPRSTFRYPDVSIVCGPRMYHSGKRSVITNPLLVVEVSSDSTAAADYGEKRLEYQMLDSLQHYLLVSQSEPRVELYTRKDDGHWDYLALDGVEKMLPLTAPSITIALADIYDGIEFDQEKE